MSLEHLAIDLKETRAYGIQMASLMSLCRVFHSAALLTGVEWFDLDETYISETLGISEKDARLLVGKLIRKGLLECSHQLYRLKNNMVDYDLIAKFGEKYRPDKMLMNLGDTNAMQLHANHIQKLLALQEEYEATLPKLSSVLRETYKVKDEQVSSKLGTEVSPAEILIRKARQNGMKEIGYILKPTRLELQQAIGKVQKYEHLSGEELEGYLVMKKNELGSVFDTSLSNQVLRIIRFILNRRYVYIPMIPKQIKFIDYINLINDGWDELTITLWLDKLEDWICGNPARLKQCKSVPMIIRNWKRREEKMLKGNSIPSRIAKQLVNTEAPIKSWNRTNA